MSIYSVGITVVPNGANGGPTTITLAGDAAWAFRRNDEDDRFACYLDSRGGEPPTHYVEIKSRTIRVPMSHVRATVHLFVDLPVGTMLAGTLDAPADTAVSIRNHDAGKEHPINRGQWWIDPL